MAKFDFDIGILGAGSAGLTAASGAAKFGAKTLLIEKEKMGGDCLHYGCVPSKTLIHTAKVRHFLRNAEVYGLPRIDLPPVDFRSVRERILSVVNTIQRHDSPERFCSLGVRVEFGEPEFADEHTVRLGGTSLRARSWVIATGSSPALPDISGLDRVPFLTNRELFYLDSLPESLIILGGGPIAIEMAQAFARLGSTVSVIQRGSQILSREDKDMADIVMESLAADGVSFHLNATVSEIRKKGKGCTVVLCKPDVPSAELSADALLVALGRRPNLDNMGIERIGIEIKNGGLALDSRLRTRHAHVYGAGDVTGTYQFTHAAGYEGGVAVTNAILRLPRKVNYALMPWCTYADPELASIGMNERRAREAGLEYTVWQEAFSANDRALAEGATAGVVKLLLGKSGKPLGIQIVGPHAGELLAPWIGIMNGGGKLSSLAGAVHPYPTLAEINRKIAGNVFAEKIFSDRVKSALRFFFNLRGRACG
ncbi:MAG TPA: FAD-dependent oxidoreductase [Dissulfurispiraceae bacterium]|nr:FAD-dependent oxidoreductase [Dissulfurispiraceae bacterium]